MLRNIMPVLAVALLATVPTPRKAQAHEMQVIQGGENFEVLWTGGPRDTLVGGGIARMEGGGDDLKVIYEPQGAHGQSAFATMSGGGDDRSFTRTEPVPAETMVAQRAPAPDQPARR